MIPEGYMPILDGDYSFLPDNFGEDEIYLSFLAKDVCSLCKRKGSRRIGIYVNDDTGKNECEICLGEEVA